MLQPQWLEPCFESFRPAKSFWETGVQVFDPETVSKSSESKENGALKTYMNTILCLHIRHDKGQENNKDSVVGCVHVGVGALTCMCVCWGGRMSTSYCPLSLLPSNKNDGWLWLVWLSG